MIDRPLTFIDKTLSTPEANLALDEALLQSVDREGGPGWLRLWECRSHAVVLGRSNRVAAEVCDDRCAADGVPVLRRCSGGGSVVIGPGCLMFTIVAPVAADEPVRDLAGSIRAVLEPLAARLDAIRPGVRIAGVSDLACEGMKFSGNAQRWLRSAFLHHGTLLYGFDLPRVARYLQPPPRAPEYRDGREHSDFVCNLGVSRETLVGAVQEAWPLDPAPRTVPALLATELVLSRYRRAEWNRQY